MGENDAPVILREYHDYLNAARRHGRGNARQGWRRFQFTASLRRLAVQDLQ
ncbi:hypothetical protein [Lonsdalea quercina]|uniref:hypothetical protein n=1 Tax=Lonsdalea quercina TaxID=71657 RepID=UPI003975A273